MLTINADGHAVFGRLHKPDEEKRMVAILDEADYNAWLDAPLAQAQALLKPFDAARLVGQAHPRAVTLRPPAATRAAAAPRAPKDLDPQTDQLF
jgi:putative SOS response-associated peptidase YedK